jgi:hypothetical protein
MRLRVGIISLALIVSFSFFGCGGGGGGGSDPEPGTNPEAIYSISGTITINGSALAGATVTLSGAGTGTAMTDSSGNYTFPNLSNGSYIITPSMFGYTFSPSSQTVAVEEANETASAFTAMVNSSQTYPYNGNCGNEMLQGVWYESTGMSYTHFPAQIEFVNYDSMSGLVYGIADGPLVYAFETYPTMCGGIMLHDATQQLVFTYGYTLSSCELVLENWNKFHHYCRGGVGNCSSCGSK